MCDGERDRQTDGSRHRATGRRKEKLRSELREWKQRRESGEGKAGDDVGEWGGLGGAGPGRRAAEAEQAGSWPEEAGPSPDCPAQASGGAGARRRAQDRHFLPPVPGSAGGADHRPRALLPAAPSPAHPDEPARSHTHLGGHAAPTARPPHPQAAAAAALRSPLPRGPALLPGRPRRAHMLGSPTLGSVGPTDRSIPGSGFAISWDNSAPLSMNHKLQTTVLSLGPLSWPRLGRDSPWQEDMPCPQAHQPLGAGSWGPGLSCQG